MSSKQDRQAARTAADLERRYKFGKSFAEVMVVATDAQKAAEKAGEAVETLDGNLTQKEIFKRLTNDGKAQGVFMDESGEIYINASYLAAGIIASLKGTVKLDLTSDTLEISIPPEEVYIPQKSIVFDQFGVKGYSEAESGGMGQTLLISPGVYSVPITGATAAYWTRLLSYDSDLYLDAIPFRWPEHKRTVRIGGNADVEILGKKVKWSSNGNGAYSLVGTDE